MRQVSTSVTQCVVKAMRMPCMYVVELSFIHTGMVGTKIHVNQPSHDASTMLPMRRLRVSVFWVTSLNDSATTIIRLCGCEAMPVKTNLTYEHTCILLCNSNAIFDGEQVIRNWLLLTPELQHVDV